MQKVWTKAEALPVFLEAFAQKRLAAQNGAVQCQYTSPYGPCIIGTLIDEQTAIRWDRSSPATNGPAAIFKGCYADEMLGMFAEGDRAWFREAQKLHDCACSFYPDVREDGLKKLEEFLAA